MKPVLLFGYGNLSRGDDALGPLVLDYVENHCALDDVELLTDFQLQIEHALDLHERKLALFIDAAVDCVNAFAFTELHPARDNSYTTHAMSPAAVLAVYQTIKKQPPPPCFLLSIKGEQFELGEDLSADARINLASACQFIGQLLGNPNLAAWRLLAGQSEWPIPLETQPVCLST
ncbi:MAG: hydrogenase maturation protease [Methylovulum sp.]